MATIPQREVLDLDEQIARIEKSLVDITRSRAETLKLVAEAEKLVADKKNLQPVIAFQAMLATAALLGAGAAIAKLFFP